MKAWERVRRISIEPWRTRLLGALLFAAAIAYFCGTGIWKLGSAQQGVVLRFGRVVRTCGPGVQLTLPYPFETLKKVDTFMVRLMPIGFKFHDLLTNVAPTEEECQFSTGDRYVVELQAQINYRVASPADYLLRIADPHGEDRSHILRKLGEEALTRRVARMSVDEVLYSRKIEIQRDAESMVQELADRLSMGVEVISVILLSAAPPQRLISAFNELTNARAYVHTAKEKAHGEAAQQLPAARGEASRTRNDAQIYAAKVVGDAAAAAERFTKIAEEARNAPEAVRRRLFLETVREFVARARWTIYPQSEGGRLRIHQVRPAEEPRPPR